MSLMENSIDFAFLKSIEFNQTNLTKLCLLFGAAINKHDSDGVTPFLHAARSGSLEVMKLLSAEGADYKARDDHGRNALLLGATYKHYDVVNYCLSIGFDPNSKSYAELSALFHTIKKGNLPITQLLINAGGSVTELNGRNKQMSLHYTALCYNSNKEIFYLLIKNGALLNQRDAKGRTPLMFALQQENFKAVKLLLDYGADIFIPDNEGNTPFMLAANADEDDIKKLAELALIAPVSLLFNYNNVPEEETFKSNQLLWNESAENFMIDEQLQEEQIELRRSHKIKEYLAKKYSTVSALRARELGNSKPLRFLNHLHPPNRKNYH